jgi:membrane-bound metal-dependent hydrolase YbcI (DUF457 family)
MDPLSHVALVSNLVRLRRAAGVPRGVLPAAVLGALAPDVDVFLVPSGWDRYMVAHQSGTHSLLGALVCAGLAAALIRAFFRDARYTPLFGAAVLGAISHICFDLLSGATIRLLWPFADVRFTNVGAFAMADPWVATTCLATAVAIWWHTERRRQIALAFTVGLLVFTAAKMIAQAEARSRFAAHVTQAGELRVLPVWGSLTKWEIYAHDHGSVSKWLIDLRHGTVERQIMVPEYGDGTTAQTAMSTLGWETVRNFRQTHDFAFARSSSTAGVTRVMWSDLRYCSSSGGVPDSAITCAVSAGGEIDPSFSEPRLIVMIGKLRQER